MVDVRMSKWNKWNQRDHRNNHGVRFKAVVTQKGKPGLSLGWKVRVVEVRRANLDVLKFDKRAKEKCRTVRFTLGSLRFKGWVKILPSEGLLLRRSAKNRMQGYDCKVDVDKLPGTCRPD
jgi:hypothetical protein